MNKEELNRPLSLTPSPSSNSTFRLDDPQQNIPGSGISPGVFRAAPVSPYLNYDSRFFQQTQPEFIFPEGSNKQRGRFELAFSQIGSSVMVGAAVGGVGGFYNGMLATKPLQLTGKLWRTQMLNYVMKQGSGTANTLGTLAVMYSAFGVLLQHVRGADDEINTVSAGTLTGLLYKSTAGLKKCAIGGGIGFSITAMYCFFQMAGPKILSPNMDFKYV